MTCAPQLLQRWLTVEDDHQNNSIISERNVLYFFNQFGGAKGELTYFYSRIVLAFSDEPHFKRVLWGMREPNKFFILYWDRTRSKLHKIVCYACSANIASFSGF